MKNLHTRAKDAAPDGDGIRPIVSHAEAYNGSGTRTSPREHKKQKNK
eukprot:COSAG02_NODE_170_length_31534_cov_33.568498_19_plen_47_part_00